MMAMFYFIARTKVPLKVPPNCDSTLRFEALPLGGVAYGRGLVGDDGLRLQLMGGPITGYFPSKLSECLRKRLFAMDPFIEFHVFKVPRMKVLPNESYA